MGSITKRQSNRWQAKVRRDGQTVSKTFALRSDAEAWARKIESEVERGVWHDNSEAESTTLDAALKRYAEEITPTKRGKRGEISIIGIWRDDPLVRLTLARIKSSDIARVIQAWKSAGLDPSTIRRRMVVLRHVFNIARKAWGMTALVNPCDGVMLPKVDDQRDRRLRPGELDALLAAARMPGAAVGLDAAIVMAVETAMRRGELVGMRWERVDLSKRIAHLSNRETKNGESRSIALSSRAVDSLKSLPRRLDGFVWPWDTASGFSSVWKRCLARARRDHVQALLRKALQERGFDGAAIDREIRAVAYRKRAPDLTTLALLERIEKESNFLTNLRFHDLRHEATSRLFEKGLGIMEVASMTGHKSLSMLKRYTHVEAEKLAAKLG